ncbi:MAG: DUF308 domain-containing protein [Oscillospiraceae bacterium]|nr:DUF308 domain-containing protein [Oscillospiraceae bacterium]
MQNVKSVAAAVVEAVIQIALGVFIIAEPMSFNLIILRIIGAALVIVGIIECIRYFVNPVQTDFVGRHLSFGLLALAAGILLLVGASYILSALPVFAIVYGIVILVSAIFKLQKGVDMLRLGISRSAVPLVSAVISIILAVIILANPFATVYVLFTFAGVSLIVDALLNLAAAILGRNARGV